MYSKVPNKHLLYWSLGLHFATIYNLSFEAGRSKPLHEASKPPGLSYYIIGSYLRPPEASQLLGFARFFESFKKSITFLVDSEKKLQKKERYEKFCSFILSFLGAPHGRRPSS